MEEKRKRESDDPWNHEDLDCGEKRARLEYSPKDDEKNLLEENALLEQLVSVAETISVYDKSVENILQSWQEINDEGKYQMGTIYDKLYSRCAQHSQLLQNEDILTSSRILSMGNLLSNINEIGWRESLPSEAPVRELLVLNLSFLDRIYKVIEDESKRAPDHVIFATNLAISSITHTSKHRLEKNTIQLLLKYANPPNEYTFEAVFQSLNLLVSVRQAIFPDEVAEMREMETMIRDWLVDMMKKSNRHFNYCIPNVVALWSRLFTSDFRSDFFATEELVNEGIPILISAVEHTVDFDTLDNAFVCLLGISENPKAVKMMEKLSSDLFSDCQQKQIVASFFYFGVASWDRIYQDMEKIECLYSHPSDIIRGFAFKGFSRAKGTVVGDQVINKFFQLSINHLDDVAASFESKELVTFLARRILKDPSCAEMYETKIREILNRHDWSGVDLECCSDILLSFFRHHSNSYSSLSRSLLPLVLRITRLTFQTPLPYGNNIPSLKDMCARHLMYSPQKKESIPNHLQEYLEAFESQQLDIIENSRNTFLDFLCAYLSHSDDPDQDEILSTLVHCWETLDESKYEDVRGVLDEIIFSMSLISTFPDSILPRIERLLPVAFDHLTCEDGFSFLLKLIEKLGATDCDVSPLVSKIFGLSTEYPSLLPRVLETFSNFTYPEIVALVPSIMKQLGNPAVDVLESTKQFVRVLGRLCPPADLEGVEEGIEVMVNEFIIPHLRREDDQDLFILLMVFIVHIFPCAISIFQRNCKLMEFITSDTGNENMDHLKECLRTMLKM